MGYVQNKIQSKLLAIPAAVAFALVYLPLKGFAFRLDLAVCASYTITMFMNARRKRGKIPLLSGDDAIPLSEILLGHVLALLALVAIIRIGVYAAPALPHWMTVSIGTTPGGRHLPAALRYLQTFMLFVVGFIESWWLTTLKTDEEKQAKNRVVRGKAAYEEHLSNRLRLR
ncbi:MAG TPA: hypothetical protein VL990_16370 [Acidobacteriaceae bacterium]|nr:hypothetical protein [Acidobacteriaceae bacterium]